jgi:cation diffusion facilitator family transporter
VVAALVGDFLVAASKIAAALWTGSAAMASEAIHSVVDTTNELLLLYGIHRSKQKADAEHPFGHGREVYFWSFVVSLLIFALGAGFSIYEGVSRVLKPVPIDRLASAISSWRSLCFRGRRLAGVVEAVQGSKRRTRVL